MRYLGGKQKIAKAIASIINNHDPSTVYLEPFMGSCWVTSQITLPKRLAGDLHDEVVELYHQVCSGWEPPTSLSKQEFEDIRDNRATGKYPKQIVAFAGFGCAFAGSYWRGYSGEKYALFTRNSLLRKKQKLKNVQFFSSDYRDLQPKGCVIYCDPPYEGASYGYRITGKKGNGNFDNKEFWDLMRVWSYSNIVYVSEYSAPTDFKCVWQKDVSVLTRNNCRAKEAESRVERLFMAGDSSSLIPDQSFHDAIGVLPNWSGFKLGITNEYR